MMPLYLFPHIQASTRTDRFSQHLMEWVDTHRNTNLFVAYSPISYIDGSLLPDFNYQTTCAGSIYIGLGDLDEGFLHGARLSNIICNGVKADEFAFPPKMQFQIIPDWFEQYIERAKCCIDPQHILYSDKERWNVSEDGKIRSCLWCNNHKQHEHIELVEKKTWIHTTHPGAI